MIVNLVQYILKVLIQIFLKDLIQINKVKNQLKEFIVVEEMNFQKNILKILLEIFLFKIQL